MSTPPQDDLAATAKASWYQFLAVYEPLRPELYRYCRYLTRNAFEAEDLVQDSLARAFVTLACMMEEVRNPRAWLFRIASNLWIDRSRRRRDELAGDVESTAASDAPEDRVVREAAGTLLAALSPQERAAVVLKDVFDFSLEDIAEALSTTTNAIKAALHRGRGKLAEPKDDETSMPAPAALDAFCAAFNARDLRALSALLLDSATIDLVGVYSESAQRGRGEQGLLAHTLFKNLSSGVKAEYLTGYLGTAPRAELRSYRGEPVIVYWYAHQDGEHVRSVVRCACDGERIAHVREYFFTADVLAEVCRELGVSFRSNGYT